MEHTQNLSSENKCIWLSHHADDRSQVMEIHRQMQKDGLSVEWEGSFADTQSWLCIVFLSESYLGNENCRAELDEIRMSGITYLVVYLENVVLPQSLAMRIGRSRALFLNDFSNVEQLCRKIYEAHPIGTVDMHAVDKRNRDLFRKYNSQQRMKRRIIGVIVAVLLCFVSVLYFEYMENDAQGAKQSEMVSQSPASEEYVLMDTDEYFVCMREFRYMESMGTWVVQLQVRNDTDDTVTFSGKHETMNGFTVKTESKGYNRPEGEYSWRDEVSPHQTKDIRIEYPAIFWQRSDADRVVEHLGELCVIASDGTEDVVQEFAVYPEGKQAAEQLDLEGIFEDTVIYRDEIISVAYLGRKPYDLSGKNADLFYLYNHSTQACDTTFFAIGSEEDSDYFSMAMTLQPNERILIPAYWTDEVYLDANVRIRYEIPQSEVRFFSDEIPIIQEH